MYTNRKINLKKKIVSRTIYHHAAKSCKLPRAVHHSTRNGLLLQILLSLNEYEITKRDQQSEIPL